MTNLEKLQKLYSMLDEIGAYRRIMGKAHFDMECCAPEEGIAKAGEDLAVLGKQLFALTHNPEYTALIVELHEDSEGLDPIQKKAVEHLYDGYKLTKNQTPEFAYEMDVAFNKAYGEWLTAKKADSWELYKDSMATLIDYTKKAIDLYDDKFPTYYTACLDQYEPGASEEQLDAFFAALKARIVPLLKKIAAEGKAVRTDFMSRPVPIPQQEALSKYLLELEGLRSSALVLMTTEHPFTTNFGNTDVRVTTHYYEDNFISNIFSTLHEGGHAMFMMYEPQELHDKHCDNNMSNAMHETISRFYENIVGRNENFINYIYENLVKLSGGVFADITPREIYEAVNVAKPGLIRIEADEVSYSLHIMVRYEIEKAFMNGEITVDEIPALWNAKYKEYLGVDVPGDGKGCLQDVHWTGMFGYFPSYALGNAYGAQILATMKKDFDFDEAIRNGEFDKIAQWLKDKVFSIASLKTPDEWIKAITGESLNTDYYLDYLEAKMNDIYF